MQCFFQFTSQDHKQKSIDFYFHLPISKESIVFGEEFRNGDFDGFARFDLRYRKYMFCSSQFYLEYKMNHLLIEIR